MGRPLQPRKCKLCGREFMPQTAADSYCPGVCSLTAGLIPTPSEKKPAASSGGGWAAKEAKFPRVMEMFALSPTDSRRWEISKTFMPEEREFARKYAKRQMALDNMIDYNCAGGMYGGGCEDEEDDGKTFDHNSLGDSDDGSI